jgi:hypothetical protein
MLAFLLVGWEPYTGDVSGLLPSVAEARRTHGRAPLRGGIAGAWRDVRRHTGGEFYFCEAELRATYEVDLRGNVKEREVLPITEVWHATRAP